MNDLKNLFELALGDGHGPVAGAPADPAADIARGRMLLRRRARNRALGAAAATAVAAAVAVPAALHGTPARPAASSPAARGSSPATGQASSIRLVAYAGAQPSGYVVKVIPAGWVIQGSTPYALVIAPAGDSDKNPDSFLGKLVVSQEAFDASSASATGWVPQPKADGRTAYYSAPQNAGGVLTVALVIEEAPGRWLNVQAPASLGWSESALTQFGLGVTILAAAQEGHG